MDFKPLDSQEIGKNIAIIRKRSKKSTEKVAAVLGIEKEQLVEVEKGEASLSLPQLEVLANFFDVPIKELLTSVMALEEKDSLDEEKRDQLVGLRNRVIALLLKQSRLEQNKLQSTLADDTGIALEKLVAYETGRTPIPVFDLEKLCTALNIPLASMFSNISDQESVPPTPQQPAQVMPDLPQEILDFIQKPINRPYLLLAKKISEMNATKLRDIAERLLEITY